jgi:hypothetical protein
MRATATAAAVIAAALLTGCNSSASYTRENEKADRALYCNDLFRLERESGAGTLDDQTADILNHEMTSTAGRLAAHRKVAKDLPAWTDGVLADSNSLVGGFDAWQNAENWCNKSDW